jgi:soluble lytic murein transglycosylase-like protein
MGMTYTAWDLMEYDRADIFDPATNIQAGSEYLQLRVDRAGGDLIEGLKRYGPTDIGYSCLYERC